MSGHDVVLEVRGLSFGYEREPILRDINLHVHAGDFLAIIGPNGGGKTTLLRVMLGLCRPWQGLVVYHGVKPGCLGYVPQFSTFDFQFPLRVWDVVAMGLHGGRPFWKRYSKTDRLAVGGALARLKLDALADMPVADLSGGQLQRVLIARAIVGEPRILCLDEPTASVDAESRDTVRDLLAELNARIPIVLVTHDITSYARQVKQIACVNRELFYHGSGAGLSHAALEKTYGCPVELIAHDIPHRVLSHAPEAHRC
jgi:zinc transport system ATP-binding protein